MERVDPRITRTRALLIDAFLELMREKAFEEISVNDITVRATVNRATFYAHFADKYALVEGLIRDSFARALAARLDAPASDANGYLRALFLAVTDHWRAVSAPCQASWRVFEPLVDAHVTARLRDEVGVWLRERDGVSAEGVELVATIVSAGLYASARQWARSAQERSPDEFADEVIPLLRVMIVTDYG